MELSFFPASTLLLPYPDQRTKGWAPHVRNKANETGWYAARPRQEILLPRRKRQRILFFTIGFTFTLLWVSVPSTGPSSMVRVPRITLRRIRVQRVGARRIWVRRVRVRRLGFEGLGLEGLGFGGAALWATGALGAPLPQHPSFQKRSSLWKV